MQSNHEDREPDGGSGEVQTEQAAPLEPFLVVDLSYGIAGAYCCRILGDGGASVVKVEGPEGDPLRRWSASGAHLSDDEDGALFEFLAQGAAGVVVDPTAEADRRELAGLLRAASVIVWSAQSPVAQRPEFSPQSLHAEYPDAVVVALSPFGLDGPWAGRAASELTVQAWAGAVGDRGDRDRAPTSVGGRTGEWLTGLSGAVAALSAHRRSVLGGGGDLVDVSMLETLALTNSVMHPVTYLDMAGHPFRSERATNIPCIEPTKDGWVGFMVATGQQWQNFCLMVGGVDWMDDESLVKYAARHERREEILAGVREWTTLHTTAEVLEIASELRIPVAPIGNGELTPKFEQFAEGGFFERNPARGFLQPAVPYRMHARVQPKPRRAAPRLGEHNGALAAVRDASVPPVTRNGKADVALPLAGVRVADFTAFWAGPVIGQYLGMLGADVIHIESPTRPDGMRHHSTRPMSEPSWWEWAPCYQGTNSNKRGFAVDLGTAAGRELARDLIQHCDVVIDNFTPRVLEGWGLDYEAVKRDDLIMLRAPAFGLSGPWRDWTGYAQTMEQVSGMAWVTGLPDGVAELPNGPCDPIAGIHATAALLIALEHRRRTGQGMLLEVPMVAGALNIAAEQVVEFSAYGNLIGRTGNRGPVAAPQGLYLTADVDDSGRRDRWVAIAVETDPQWRALRVALGSPAWAAEPRLDTADGRRAAHDLIDEHLASWCADRTGDDIVEQLWPRGVPVGIVLSGHEQPAAAGLGERGAFETVEHPVTGPVTQLRFPMRFGAGPHRHHRRHAPMLGEHNEDIIVALLGRSAEELQRLTAEGIVGEAVPGNPFTAAGRK
ncbi:CaiB/BaiF CoA-transferase family protein [Streptomyces gilvus]|uniref:CaiB/BaiF CoA-transferase family protein n=1 Tax=Streptomyces gilvus TaxID=2920937 RepID=UPI001F0E41DE|nr:CoA transferase [Streptomyces sp. CME 23]MCH5675654.1 CoA transferase [Streptomyces sp. CME 23]